MPTRSTAPTRSRARRARATCRRGCRSEASRRSWASDGLSDGEIDTIARWARAGAPEGRRPSAGRRRHFRPTGSSGRPTSLSTLPRPYTHRPGHHDVFRNIVLRLPAGGPRLVRAVEFRPGSAPIHHAIIRVDRIGRVAAARRRRRRAGIRRHGRAERAGSRKGISSAGRPAAARLSRRTACRGGSTPAAISSSNCTCFTARSRCRPADGRPVSDRHAAAARP